MSEGLKYTHISHIVKDNNRPKLIKGRIKMESIEVFLKEHQNDMSCCICDRTIRQNFISFVE